MAVADFENGFVIIARSFNGSWGKKLGLHLFQNLIASQIGHV